MRRFCLTVLLAASALAAYAQSYVWSHVPNPQGVELVRASRQLSSFSTFDADPSALQNMLRFAPIESVSNFNYIVYMPTPDGSI